jgi:integrase
LLRRSEALSKVPEEALKALCCCNITITLKLITAGCFDTTMFGPSYVPIWSAIAALAAVGQFVLLALSAFFRVANASKRMHKPRSLTVEEFQTLLRTLGDDVCIRTAALLAVSFGLRISELLGLRWSDVDWLNKTIRIERGVSKQIVDEVKTKCSARTMVCADELLEVLKAWRQTTQFSASDDWMFASPVHLGRLPISYTHVWRTLGDAAKRAGIAHISSHSFRHTHRSWLDSVHTAVGVQKQMMRHASIATTMNLYGDASTADMRQAHERVVKLALSA